MYRFPYSHVPKGSKIVIYGAGNVGKEYLLQLENDTDYIVSAIVDKNVKAVFNKKVLSPAELIKVKFDYIVIAIDSLAISMQIRSELLDLGISENKMVFSAFSLLDEKTNSLMRAKDRLLIDNIGSRLDKRLIRLEILQYYSIEKNYNSLGMEEKALLDEIQNTEELGERVFPEDRLYVEELGENVPFEFTKDNISSEDDGFYADFSGEKLFLGTNRVVAEQNLYNMWFHYERENPHTYFNPEDDGIEVKPGEVIYDIGAAEGYFGIRHLSKSKKVFLFESDLYWIAWLNKCNLTDSKVIIENGFVGDEEGCIKIDDYLKTHDRPTLVKVDVEGADLAVLRGMKNLIEDYEPLTILVATYHRQEDYDRVCKILNPEGEPPRFDISHSRGFYWHIPDAKPPYFRRGILRARKIIK